MGNRNFCGLSTINLKLSETRVDSIKASKSLFGSVTQRQLAQPGEPDRRPGSSAPVCYFYILYLFPQGEKDLHSKVYPQNSPHTASVLFFHAEHQHQNLSVQKTSQRHSHQDKGVSARFVIAQFLDQQRPVSQQRQKTETRSSSTTVSHHSHAQKQAFKMCSYS